MKAFSIQSGLLSTLPVSVSSSTFAVLGTVPAISANGAANGILWTIDPAGQLHAYDAADLGHRLYQGSVGATSIKFSTPTIANGKVYVGTSDSLAVFGLQDPAPGSVAAVVNAGPVAPGSIVTVFGSNLAPRAAAASNSIWPEVLEGTSVFINGIAMPLAYVSPTQINAQIPYGTSPGQATLTVVSGNRVLPPFELAVSRAGRLK